METQETPETRVEVGFSMPMAMLATVFGVVGICIWAFMVSQLIPNAMNDPTAFIFIGVALIIFGGGAIWGLILVLRILFEDKAAFVVDSKGIEIKNLYPMPTTFVSWDNVTHIRESYIRYNVLQIYITDNQEFINKQPNVLLRLWLRILKLRHGTPFVILPSLLNKNNQIILKLMREHYEAARLLK